MHETREFPKYVYHNEYDRPERVDTKDQLRDKLKKGWSLKYIHKSYPRWVKGILIQNKEEEQLILNAHKKAPKVIKETVVSDSTGKIHSHTGKGSQTLVLKPPLKGSVQVPKSFEVVKPDGDVLKETFETYAQAREKQKSLNKDNPGHKARKK